MDDYPLLDKPCWTALEILNYEVWSIKDCIAEGLPWFPIDPIQFDWAMRTYRNWNPDDADTYLLTFPGRNWVKTRRYRPDILSRRRRKRPRSNGSLMSMAERRSPG